MTPRERRGRLRLGRVLLALVLSAISTAVETTAQDHEPVVLPQAIPLFPLQDVMLFPDMPRPLHVFEPRYREMLLEALVSDRIIGMVMLKPGHEDDYFGTPPVFAVGCAGVISQIEELPDGRYNIVLTGLTKFRIKAEKTTRTFRLAEVEAIPDTLEDEDRDLLRAYRPRLLELFSRVSSDVAPSPEEMPDPELVNGLAQFLRLDPLARQGLLERVGPLERARGLLELAGQGKSAAARPREP